jgi:NAD(P)-dependent dehydrogenase (short-subunit alcohol dehydrogenase family)
MQEQRWGRIVNVASIASTDGGYKQAHYASSKAALIGLTRSIALEFAPVGITSNAVLPGPIATPKLLETPEDVIDGMLEWVPAARLGQSEEVASVIAFLCSDDAAYVNGTSIPVDGASMLLQFKFARRSRR